MKPAECGLRRLYCGVCHVAQPAAVEESRVGALEAARAHLPLRAHFRMRARVSESLSLSRARALFKSIFGDSDAFYIRDSAVVRRSSRVPSLNLARPAFLR